MSAAWFAIKLLLGGWLKRLSGAATALLGSIRRNPWPSAVIALCALLAVKFWWDAGVIAGKDLQIAALTIANKSKQATIDKMTAEAKAADVRYRAAEKDLAAGAEKTNKEKDDAIAHVLAERDNLLAELRKRPSRSDAPASPAAITGNGETGIGATGAQLYREDASFLVGEASRADIVRTSLKACYAQYEAARVKLESLAVQP